MRGSFWPFSALRDGHKSASSSRSLALGLIQRQAVAGILSPVTAAVTGRSSPWHRVPSATFSYRILESKNHATVRILHNFKRTTGAAAPQHHPKNVRRFLVFLKDLTRLTMHV